MSAAPRLSYLICCMPRSGSWLLADGLTATGLAGRPEEYFWDIFHESYLEQWGRPPIRSYADFLSHAFRHGTTPNSVFGAKIHWGELVDLCARLADGADTAELSCVDLVRRHFPALRCIHLRRDDVVRQAISWHRALRTARWFEIRGEQGAPPAEIRPDWRHIFELEQELRAADVRWEAFFAEAGVEPLGLVYEDLVEDYASTLRRALAFLGLPDADVMPIAPARLQQQRDATTEAWVCDYLVARRSILRS